MLMTLTLSGCTALTLISHLPFPQVQVSLSACTSQSKSPRRCSDFSWKSKIMGECWSSLVLLQPGSAQILASGVERGWLCWGSLRADLTKLCLRWGASSVVCWALSPHRGGQMMFWGFSWICQQDLECSMSDFCPAGMTVRSWQSQRVIRNLMF